MGIAESKLGNLTERLKVKTSNEHCKEDSQEKDGSEDNCNKNDGATLFYGAQETEVSEGGEADLHNNAVGCKKNPGHRRFVPVKDFNIKHLPESYHDNDVVELIKATADLTVRVDVTATSTERPEFWPNTKQLPYPFHNKTGSGVMRLGTGMVWNVNKTTEGVIQKYIKGTCKCQKCQHSDTPSKVWGEVKMYTATHVVFDDLEARHTACRFFYDGNDSPLVTLDGWTVWRVSAKDDWCMLKCVTCDVDLLNTLHRMVRRWDHLWRKVNSECLSFGDEDKLIFIVSHPHGCPKQVSVGHWINRYTLGVFKTKYTYTACTCPGSSGAYVHSLGLKDNWYYDHHVHSGVNSEGTNFSGAGCDWN